MACRLQLQRLLVAQPLLLGWCGCGSGPPAPRGVSPSGGSWPVATARPAHLLRGQPSPLRRWAAALSTCSNRGRVEVGRAQLRRFCWRSSAPHPVPVPACSEVGSSGRRAGTGEGPALPVFGPTPRGGADIRTPQRPSECGAVGQRSGALVAGVRVGRIGTLPPFASLCKMSLHFFGRRGNMRHCRRVYHPLLVVLCSQAPAGRITPSGG